MLPRHFQDLIRHMEWADALVWNSVLAVSRAHSDKAIRERLHHIHTVQWAYLHIWRGEPLDMPDASKFGDLRAIHAWAREYYRQVVGHLDTLGAGVLEREVPLPWAQRLVERWGTAHPVTLAETILQITSHSTYHRGQVNARLRELGGEPPLTDFVAWIWMGRPGPAWAGPPAT